MKDSYMLLHVNYVQSTCTECMSCYVMLYYVMLCYAMVGCCAVPCPKNFSAQSDPVSFCASDNKRLVTVYNKVYSQHSQLAQEEGTTYYFKIWLNATIL